MSQPAANISTETVAEEKRLRGVAIAPGIAIGPAFLFSRAQAEVVRQHVPPEAVPAEIQRFQRALDRSEYNLDKIATVAQDKLGSDSASIFEAQKLILRDATLVDGVIAQIRQEQCNAEYAVHVVLGESARRLEASSNEYLRARTQDLYDIRDRIVMHLRRSTLLSSVDPDAVVIAENLSAADIVLFSRRGILGYATDFGGSTSHVSIIARSLGVPAIAGMHTVTEQVTPGETIILDGFNGQVIVNPDEETLALYRVRQERHGQLLLEQDQLAPLPAETLDGHRISLRANLDVIEELAVLEKNGAEGIGLCRTEILMLMLGSVLVSEEQQFRLYSDILAAAGDQPVTFRVLDLGGDKVMPMGHREHNPFLGWRGIRVMLDKPDVLKVQLRAILRAGAGQRVRLLLPMVTTLSEVAAFKAVLQEVQADLGQRGVATATEVLLGIMVEVPAVALLAEQFAEVVDFFSIGTNDLTQYVLAVDRGNDLVSDLYQELHPAVLRLVEQTVAAGHRKGLTVSVCGELATNPRAIPILLGLGVDELSASPTYLPEIKRIIRAVDFAEAQRMAAQALQAHDADAVVTMLDGWLDQHCCDMRHVIEQSFNRPVSGDGQ